MKRGSWLRAAAGFAGLLAWIGLALARLPLPTRLALAAAAAACVWYLVSTHRRRREAENRARVIRLLNHHRHDWMNELQVLFGYTRLKKYDILPDYMDKIRTRALHDSFLCKLGNPALIVYLLEKRTENDGCSVEVELETEIDLRRLALGEQEVYRIVRGIADRMLRFACSSGGEHGTLSIGFDEDDGKLLIDFVCRKESDWTELADDLRLFLKKWKRLFEIREEEFGEDQAVVALALPLMPVKR